MSTLASTAVPSEQHHDGMTTVTLEETAVKNAQPTQEHRHKRQLKDDAHHKRQHEEVAHIGVERQVIAEISECLHDYELYVENHDDEIEREKQRIETEKNLILKEITRKNSAFG